MPFTPAHVAAVLPVVAVRSRWVVPAAWVVGSMAPDLVWFLAGRRAYALGHSVPGLPTVDLVLGVVVVLLWRLVLVAPVRDLVPEVLGERLPDRSGLSPAERPGLLLGVVAGAATHVVWDSLTHRGRWGPEHLVLLGEDLGPLPGYRWAQYVSGVLGLGIVALVVLRRVREAPPRPVPDRRATPAQRAAAAAAVAVPTVLAGAVALVASLDAGTEVALVRGASRAGATALLAVLLVGSLWWRLPRRARVPAG